MTRLKPPHSHLGSAERTGPMLPDRLRTGRKVGRTIYAQAEGEPSDAHALIGVMDTRELAAAVVAAYNRPSLSLSQIDWLEGATLLRGPVDRMTKKDVLAALRALRTELTRGGDRA